MAATARNDRRCLRAAAMPRRIAERDLPPLPHLCRSVGVDNHAAPRIRASGLVARSADDVAALAFSARTPTLAPRSLLTHNITFASSAFIMFHPPGLTGTAPAARWRTAVRSFRELAWQPLAASSCECRIMHETRRLAALGMACVRHMAISVSTPS
jgi:hypothetical protein